MQKSNQHEGATVGELTKFGETDAYLSYPKDKSTKNAVLIVPDAAGLPSNNSKLIADQFAANGYFCVLIDPFHGDPVPMDAMMAGKFDIFAWLAKHPTPRVDPVVTEVIQTMRSKYGVEKLGIAGYCFGGKYVVRFLGATGAAANAKADVGYTAHPSMVDAEELRAIDGPLSIAAAEIDQIMPPEKRHETEGILKELSDAKKTPYQMTLYGAVSHGFATKADLSDKRMRSAKELAFFQAVQWYDYHLKA
ncbi:MAG: hypothetical protein M1828_003046 [Chrysothrix sp. TS-e1954]|nr:MAG: hypothetical protein M1828_003046 [Chrysothrix sp. TS-e1954]